MARVATGERVSTRVQVGRSCYTVARRVKFSCVQIELSFSLFLLFSPAFTFALPFRHQQHRRAYRRVVALVVLFGLACQLWQRREPKVKRVPRRDNANRELCDESVVVVAELNTSGRLIPHLRAQANSQLQLPRHRHLPDNINTRSANSPARVGLLAQLGALHFELVNRPTVNLFPLPRFLYPTSGSNG